MEKSRVKGENRAIPIVLEEAAEVLGISVEDSERQTLRALLEKELRSIQVELLSICQKYRVSSCEGMND
jgi:hypothetical protein